MCEASPALPATQKPSESPSNVNNWHLARSQTSKSLGIFKLTAYCPCFRCCGKSDGITASNKKAKPKHTVACNFLPFGTKLMIDGDIYTVEDRGAKSHFGTKDKPLNRLDIFFNSHEEARQFGIKHTEVILL